MIQKLYRCSILTAFVFFTLFLTACGSSGTGDGESESPIDSPLDNPESEMPSTSDVSVLRTTDKIEGTGEEAAAGQELTVHYEGWLFDADAKDFRGELFDSTIGGAPYIFTLGAGEVIPGWDQGIEGMKVGGQRTLIIPSSLAYGPQGLGPVPPNTAVVFDVELLSID